MDGIEGSRLWSVAAADPVCERRLVEALGVTPLVARVLVARGIGDVDEARRFLTPSLERDWADPLDIPGMEEAADRVEEALSRGETIAVFGDFDVDGMTATAILTLALRSLGADVHPFIPHRFDEGYGLSEAALERVVKACRPDLIVTVDNGIASAREVALLTEAGIDVVITDHHEPGDLVPQGVPVTDPKLSASCASRELAGAGVALKLISELGRRLGYTDLWRAYVDLATLGTVSDMMLLEGENRSLVKEGIATMQRSTRPGIVALAATAALDLSSLTADQLPFTIIPRLNAAGRMGSTDVAFELLVCDDPPEALRLAGELEAINSCRRETEAALAEAVLAEVESSYHGEAAIVVSGVGWHEGVKGIVASRVVSTYQVPAIVFSVSDGVARGSGRSVGSVDLFHAVEQCSDLLMRFGGHAGAVGVTCAEERIDEFRRRLQACVAKLPAEQFEVKRELTAFVTLDELSCDGIEAMEALQPFGQGNKKPMLGVRGVCMRYRSRVGATANHLRFVATDGVSSVPAIMFRAPDIERAVAYEGAVDLAFEAVNETWQERTKPKLMVRDIIYRDGGSSAPHPKAEGRADAPVRPSTAPPQLAGLSEADLTDRLRRELIGDHPFLPAQKAALERLGQGRNVLAIMATGRGKSLIFHVHAARTWLSRGAASIFVYPLRALVGDQRYHLVDAFARLGIEVRVLTGETPQAEREEVYRGLGRGEVGIVLTTPEYLAIHARRFVSGRPVGFVVIDEAHHAGQAKGGYREAYLALPQTLGALGSPTVLATTATASDEVASEIGRLLGIERRDVVIDRTTRDNLEIADLREARDREAEVASIVAHGAKTVIYVNSREETVALTRSLRRALGDAARRIAFYNAGLSRSDRAEIEEAFRRGELSCIVSTSAFGEGVNLPDIRNVVLYHLPFGAVEFNQMSGRAGRDGSPACVSLLYRSQDVRINEAIVSAQAPERERLVTLYRALRGLCAPGRPVSFATADLVAGAGALDPATIAAGLAIFSELGFAEVARYNEAYTVTMAPSPAHMDLAQSARYLEGIHRAQEFAAFREWALTADADALLSQLRAPIAPSFGTVADG